MRSELCNSSLLEKLNKKSQNFRRRKKERKMESAACHFSKLGDCKYKNTLKNKYFSQEYKKKLSSYSSFECLKYLLICRPITRYYYRRVDSVHCAVYSVCSAHCTLYTVYCMICFKHFTTTTKTEKVGTMMQNTK